MPCAGKAVPSAAGLFIWGEGESTLCVERSSQGIKKTLPRGPSPTPWGEAAPSSAFPTTRLT
jgi:hypothetical protein